MSSIYEIYMYIVYKEELRLDVLSETMAPHLAGPRS